MLILFLMNVELVVWNRDLVGFESFDDSFKCVAAGLAFLFRGGGEFNFVNQSRFAERGKAKNLS